MNTSFGGVAEFHDSFIMISFPTQAAQAGALATTEMEARAGRASYVHSSQLTQPDPGAHAVGIWMEAIYKQLH